MRRMAILALALIAVSACYGEQRAATGMFWGVRER